MKKLIFEKKQLKLKEEELTFNSDSINKQNNNNQVNVEPSSNGSPNLTTDLNNARTENPNAQSFNVNLSTYADKNKSNTPVVANINANGLHDAVNTVQNAMKSNPQLSNSVNNGNAVAKININGGQAVNNNLKVESVQFTKDELDKILMSL